jgi:predicted outer membrane repeat protein
MRAAHPGAGRHAGSGRTSQALVTVAALVAALAAAARADTIVVDASGAGDCSTLAEGFAAAASGDTILVAPGIYSGAGNRDLEITDKALTIESRDGAENTVLELEWHTGIAITGAGTIPSVIRGLTFRHSGAMLYDGALSCEGTSVTVRDCRFEENAVNGPCWSAALSVTRCVSVDVERCRFVGNTLAMTTGDSSTGVRACLFEGNGVPEGGSQWGHGGGLYCGGSGAEPVVVDSCSFIGNWATERGGAMVVWPGYVTIRDSTFEGNWADEDGGAICIDYLWGATSATTSIARCTFRSNGAHGRGGAIYGKKATCEISDCLFEGNEAPRGGAACVYLKGTAYPKLTRCTFVENSAEMGAGVFCENAAPIIQDCLFLENSAHLWAGGVCGVATEEYPGARIMGCTFVRNAAHRGAAVVADQSPSVVESCTFYGNMADDAVIASLRSSEVFVSKCAIAFSGRGAPLTCQFGYLEAHECVIYGNASGDSLSCYLCACHAHDNLFTDPLFCDVVGGDFTLCENSPCLPGNNSWGLLVGAWDAGCGDCDSAVTPASWGRIKALYRFPVKGR